MKRLKHVEAFEAPRGFVVCPLPLGDWGSRECQVPLQPYKGDLEHAMIAHIHFVHPQLAQSVHVTITHMRGGESQ